MPPRAKIQDVARLAGVSLSTVSAVLKSKAIVRPPTRQRVLNAIASLQYRPDHFASNLARRRTNVFGLIVSDLRIHSLPRPHRRSKWRPANVASA